jgi:hypothetical protein
MPASLAEDIQWEAEDYRLKEGTILAPGRFIKLYLLCVPLIHGMAHEKCRKPERLYPVNFTHIQ